MKENRKLPSRWQVIPRPSPPPNRVPALRRKVLSIVWNGRAAGDDGNWVKEGWVEEYWRKEGWVIEMGTWWDVVSVLSTLWAEMVVFRDGWCCEEGWKKAWEKERQAGSWFKSRWQFNWKDHRLSSHPLTQNQPRQPQRFPQIPGWPKCSCTQDVLQGGG